jgi:hypothetical protein
MPGYLTRDMSFLAKTDARPISPARPESVRRSPPARPIRVIPLKHPGSVKLTRRTGPVIVDEKQHDRHRIEQFAKAVWKAWPWLSPEDRSQNANRLTAMNLAHRNRFGELP